MTKSILRSLLLACTGFLSRQTIQPVVLHSSSTLPKDPGHPKARRQPVSGASGGSEGRRKRGIHPRTNRHAWQCVFRRSAW